MVAARQWTAALVEVVRHPVRHSRGGVACGGSVPVQASSN